MTAAEITTKQQRLAVFLEAHHLDAVLLQNRANFAWITGGGDNHVPNDTPEGVAAILAMADSRLCITNSIEAPRMRDEVLTDADVDVVEVPWWDAHTARERLRQVLDGRRVAADADVWRLGLPPLPPDFAELRWSLTEAEIERYRDGGHRAASAMENACRAIEPGDTEHDIAGRLDGEVRAMGCNPLVTLVAVDDRIARYRHPLPTPERLERRAMLVTCSERAGLFSCLTRLVSFGPPTDDVERRMRAVVEVDARAIDATRKGRRLGDVFQELQDGYADAGFPDEWQHHHQGGSTGYAGREVIASPDSDVEVRESQAFAWNPSIAGVKSEDTIFCTGDGCEVLTAASEDWPQIRITSGRGTLSRPGILVR